MNHYLFKETNGAIYIISRLIYSFDLHVLS